MEKTLAVFQLLSQALTPDPAVQRAAEHQLSQLEGQQGFCGCLAVRFEDPYMFKSFPYFTHEAESKNTLKIEQKYSQMKE